MSPSKLAPSVTRMKQNQRPTNRLFKRSTGRVGGLLVAVQLVTGTLLAIGHLSRPMLALTLSPEAAQARAGGLEPSDYVDEAGELDVMANQQQIPTAQLMAAAGHTVPENFFLPGGTIPAFYQRYATHQPQHPNHQQMQQQGQTQVQMQAPSQQQLEVAASQQVRHRLPVATMKMLRDKQQMADLLAAASSAESLAGPPADASLIDFSGYNLAAPQPEVGQPMELAEFLGPAGQTQALYEHQQQVAAEQQLVAEMAALNHQQALAYQQQQQVGAEPLQASNRDAREPAGQLVDPMASEGSDGYASGAQMGPAYQIYGDSSYSGQETSNKDKVYGLPTKSSSKEPSGMLKPLGNPKTVSSPVIDFVANQLPKTSQLEKLADKIPQTQTPTVFSFSSSKDPVEKTRSVQQKKRTVMRQAENLAKSMIKSINDKFGTTIGDQTDIPFLLSTLGPLGFAQNVLFDPTLLITLLNSAEKTYFSDVLPGPAKMAIRPVLNIFRVPNRKRDKANLLNIISYLASGGQTASTPVASKNRQSLGVEKQSQSKASKT